jgi:hypothetical protein
MKVRPSIIGWGLVAIGLLLTVPSSAFLMTDPPDADEVVEHTPALRIPFDALNNSRSASVAFRIPSRWRDMRSKWADPIYRVHARLRERGLGDLSFEQLGLTITVVRGGQALDLKTPPYEPYAFNPETDNLGYVFNPDPGDELVTNVSVRPNSTLPSGELIVQPFADRLTKDRIVGAMIDEDVRPWAKRVLLGGLALITFGTLVTFLTRHSTAARLTSSPH